MVLARKKLISLDSTLYYHCISRCVRRAYLCGIDPLTKKNHTHRRKYIEDKLFKLANIFCIDIASYAIMSNHYHLVLRVDKDGCKALSNYDVVYRWHQIFAPGLLVSAYLENPKILSQSELKKINKKANKWRERLYDISWFMRCLNEDVARMANHEDKCTGRFWEGRFKSQALTDEKGLLACMAYVDLNPVRAGISRSPTTSNYTAIKKRMALNEERKINNRAKQGLLKFKDDKSQDEDKYIPFKFKHYIELLTWTSKNYHKKSRSPDKTSPDVEGMKFSEKNFDDITDKFEEYFKSIVGSTKSYTEAYKKIGLKRQVGYKRCKQFFS